MDLYMQHTIRPRTVDYSLAFSISFSFSNTHIGTNHGTTTWQNLAVKWVQLDLNQIHSCWWNIKLNLEEKCSVHATHLLHIWLRRIVLLIRKIIFLSFSVHFKLYAICFYFHLFSSSYGSVHLPEFLQLFIFENEFESGDG